MCSGFCSSLRLCGLRPDSLKGSQRAGWGRRGSFSPQPQIRGHLRVSQTLGTWDAFEFRDCTLHCHARAGRRDRPSCYRSRRKASYRVRRVNATPKTTNRRRSYTLICTDLAARPCHLRSAQRAHPTEAAMSKPCSAPTSHGTASCRSLADSTNGLQHMEDNAVPDLDMGAAVVALLLLLAGGVRRLP